MQTPYRFLNPLGEGLNRTHYHPLRRRIFQPCCNFPRLQLRELFGCEKGFDRKIQSHHDPHDVGRLGRLRLPALNARDV